MRYLATLLLAVLLAPTFIWAAPIQCECIRALREIRGVNIRGDAWTILPTHSREAADIGDVILFDMGWQDHGAQIIGFEGLQTYDGYTAPETIIVWTANWPKKCAVSVERIDWLDPRIKGIYKPVSTASF